MLSLFMAPHRGTIRVALSVAVNCRQQILLKIIQMEKLALLARVEAKPGKEQQVADFLKSALPLAEAETGTVR